MINQALTFPKSLLLGSLDQAYGTFVRVSGKKQPKYFSGGLGSDLGSFYQQQEKWHRTFSGSDDTRMLFRSKDMEWSSKQVVDDICIVHEIECPSPMAEHLPTESKNCRFHLVEPLQTTQQHEEDGKEESSPKKDKVYVIMLASTGEAGNAARLVQAKELAQQHGWSSIILNHAFMGKCRPSYQREGYFDTVVDCVKFMEAVKQEGMALARWVLSEFDQQNSRVCFTGFSMGAGMAMVCATMCLKCGIDGSRVSVASYCPTSNFASFTDGVFTELIDLKAYQGKKKESRGEILRRLGLEFGKSSISSLTGDLPQSKKISAARLMCLRHDHVVLRTYFNQATRYLQDTTKDQQLQVQWLPGGHVSALIYRSKHQTPLIEAAVQAMLAQPMN